MKIGRITELDEKKYQTIQCLIKQLNPKLALPSREYLEEILKSDSSVMFAAIDDNGTMHGMLTLAVCRIPSGICTHIEDVVVEDCCRGQGIGEALVRAALAEAESLGAKQVDLTSNPSREAANRLYRRIGFAPYETNLYRFVLENKIPD